MQSVIYAFCRFIKMQLNIYRTPRYCNPSRFKIEICVYQQTNISISICECNEWNAICLIGYPITNGYWFHIATHSPSPRDITIVQRNDSENIIIHIYTDVFNCVTNIYRGLQWTNYNWQQQSSAAQQQLHAERRRRRKKNHCRECNKGVLWFGPFGPVPKPNCVACVFLFFFLFVRIRMIHTIMFRRWTIIFIATSHVRSANISARHITRFYITRGCFAGSEKHT